MRIALVDLARTSSHFPPPKHRVLALRLVFKNIHEKEVHRMEQPHAHNNTSDEDMLRHIGYCGIIVTVIALAIAWVANSVA